MTTPGRAAYEAYLTAVGDPLLPPWDELTSAEYRGWEAAAQAAIKAAQVADDAGMRDEMDQLRDERDRLADALADNPDPLVAFGRSQVEHFRELVAEILSRAVFSVNEYDLINEWRERAGLAVPDVDR